MNLRNQARAGLTRLFRVFPDADYYTQEYGGVIVLTGTVHFGGLDLGAREVLPSDASERDVERAVVSIAERLTQLVMTAP